MDGKQEPDEALSVAGRGDDDLQELLAFCSHVLRDLRQAGDRAGIIGHCRRLEEFHSAIDALLTHFRLSVALGSVSGVTPGAGSSPMASEAVERLRRAINVIARRDT